MANKKQSRREIADQLRNQQKRADKRQGMVIVGVCGVIALVIVGLAAFQPIKEWWDLRQYNDTAISEIGAPASACSDITTKKADGNQEHVDPGTEIEYAEVPPAFGPHEVYPDSMERKLYTEQDRPRLEMLVHNLEHGYTFLWYDQTVAADDEQMDELRAIATKLKGTGNMRLKFKAVPWTEDDGKAFPDGKHVALTHWSKGGKEAKLEDNKQVGVFQYCDAVSGKALDDFMLQYPFFDSPEPYGG